MTLNIIKTQCQNLLLIQGFLFVKKNSSIAIEAKKIVRSAIIHGICPQLQHNLLPKPATPIHQQNSPQGFSNGSSSRQFLPPNYSNGSEKASLANNSSSVSVCKNETSAFFSPSVKFILIGSSPFLKCGSK
jgi:hypothetical protein